MISRQSNILPYDCDRRLPNDFNDKRYVTRFVPALHLRCKIPWIICWLPTHFPDGAKMFALTSCVLANDLILEDDITDILCSVGAKGRGCCCSRVSHFDTAREFDTGKKFSHYR